MTSPNINVETTLHVYWIVTKAKFIIFYPFLTSIILTKFCILELLKKQTFINSQNIQNLASITKNVVNFLFFSCSLITNFLYIEIIFQINNEFAQIELMFFSKFQMVCIFLNICKTILEIDEDQYVCDVNLFHCINRKLRHSLNEMTVSDECK